MMDDVLIAVDNDLASNIAVRYTCMLEKVLGFNVQAIHSPDMDDKSHSPGGGWVHQKWENAVLHQAGKEIANLVHDELIYNCIGEPKIIPGNRDQAILEEVRLHSSYGFLIEGFLHQFEPDRFLQRLESRLYQHLPCPVLMVKNLVNPKRGIQIVGTPDTVSSVLLWFFKLFHNFPGYSDILVCDFDQSKRGIDFPENDGHLISELEDRFQEQGKKLGHIRTAKGPADELSLLVRDHAVTMCQIPEPQDTMSVMLSMSPCPIMFCPKFKTA
jgi:hypothetical protein